MLNVFITVDTEIWCDGWDNIDARFPDAFKRYVYGPTSRGDYGLPIQFKILNEFGLMGVFFVEPLFATRFGMQPLQELVEITQGAGQEVQLHLHTEWVDEAHEPLIENIDGKRQLLTMFSRSEQATLIGKGLHLLHAAGAGPINAFRAGNFAVNSGTLLALSDNGLEFDSSYNAASDAGVEDVSPQILLTQPTAIGDVVEYPVSVYRDRGPSSLRHVQLTACSFKEMKYILNKASDFELDSIVIVSHNFELLNAEKNRPDTVVSRRFSKLCEFLDKNRDRFVVRGFTGLEKPATQQQPDPMRSRIGLTASRFAEQAFRRMIS